MELRDVASRIAALGDDLTGAVTRLAATDPGARAFAADGPGELFAAGAALRASYQSALAARERELLAHGARLTDLAAAVRQAAEHYDAAEQSSHTGYGEAR
jgi:hypothetical protein